MSAPRQSHWHDRTVANAADAWLTEPRDTQAYRRLVEAIERRRAWLQPTLDQGGELDTTPPSPTDHGPELLDDLGANRPPTRLGARLATDPHVLLDQLRAGEASEHDPTLTHRPGWGTRDGRVDDDGPDDA